MVRLYTANKTEVRIGCVRETTDVLFLFSHWSGTTPHLITRVLWLLMGTFHLNLVFLGTNIYWAKIMCHKKFPPKKSSNDDI